MNCPNCKQPLDRSWSFCDSCGFQAEPHGRDTVADAVPVTTERPGVPLVTGPPGMGPAMAAPGSAARGPAAPGPVPAARPPGEPTGGDWLAAPSAMRPPGTSASVPSEMLSGSPVLPRAPILPGSSILLGYQERLLRQYAAVQLRTREKGEGTLYVTDSRVVFYAQAKGRGTQRGSMLMQQTNVADITGLTAFVSRRVSIGLFLLTCICLLFALSSLLVVPPVALLWLALAVICIIALVRGAARRGNTGVIIYSRADGHSPISFGTFDTRRGLIGSLAQALGGPFLALFGVFTVFDVLVGFPGQDSNQVINELGALILDLQTRGNLAFEHYGIDTEQSPPART